MKSIVIALPILFLMFIIGSNALSFSSTVLNNEKRESYLACIRLRKKAPNLNLNCENLDENINSEEKYAKETYQSSIKFLSSKETETRKVNKSEEIKLRNLVKKLSVERKLRKD